MVLYHSQTQGHMINIHLLNMFWVPKMLIEYRQVLVEVKKCNKKCILVPSVCFYGKSILKSILNTVKPVLSGHSKRTPKLVFNTNYRLMQVKSIAECSKGSILQYFQPSLSCTYPLRPFFYILLSGSLRQVLLYMQQGY